MIRHYLDGRLFEWTFSVGSVWLAVVVFVWPETVAVGAFRQFTVIMSVESLSIFAVIVGGVGCVALATNGVSLVTGPLVRGACAVLRSFLWGQFAYALWLYSVAQSAPSLGLGFWVLFTTSELYVAYRAVMDASLGYRAHLDQRDT